MSRGKQKPNLVDDESLLKLKHFCQNRIIQLLTENNISELKLSYELGRGRTFIHNMTSGKNFPSMQGLHDICQYFGITLAEFFDPGLLNPSLDKDLHQEINRVCNNNPRKLEKFYQLLCSISANDLDTFFELIEKLTKVHFNSK